MTLLTRPATAHTPKHAGYWLVYFGVLALTSTSDGCRYHSYSRPHICGQLLGHGGPLSIGRAPTFPSLPSVVLRLYRPIFTYNWAKAPHAKTVCPLCTLSAAQTLFFPRLLLFSKHVSWRSCDHLWCSNGPQILWWAEPTAEMMIVIIYSMLGHKETVRKFTFCSKSFSLIFPFQSLVSYKYAGQRLYHPPLYTCCSHHWE